MQGPGFLGSSQSALNFFDFLKNVVKKLSKTKTFSAT